MINSNQGVQHTPSTAFSEYSILRVQHTPSTAYSEYSILRVQHTPSTAYSEYSILRVQHTPSTAYSQYSILPVLYTLSTLYAEHCIHRVLHHPMISFLTHPANISALSGPCCTEFVIFPQLRVSQWIESQLPSHMPFNLPHPDSLSPDLPPSDHSPRDKLSRFNPPILIDYGLQVHLPAHSISTSVDLQTRSITCSDRISEFTRSQPSNASPKLLDPGLQVDIWVHTILVSKCIFKLARSRPARASLSLLTLGLQVHLQTRFMLASKRLSRFTRFHSPSAPPKFLNPGLQVHW